MSASSPVESVDTVVIGAGVVGLACARALALAGREVLILEAADAFGTVTSSRNSEVIHAGIYYPSGSLKAALCVPGKRALYEYARSHGVGHRNCGKLIVATAERDRDKLAAIHAQAKANGVNDLEALSPAEVRALEPEVSCVAALLSPSTGIVDSHGLMLAYLGDAEAAGASLALRSPVERGAVTRAGIELDVGGDEPMRLRARIVVNSAGLHAQALARKIDGYRADLAPGSWYCKGSYYSLTGRAPFSRLVYPMPAAAGLGVHVTLDLAGQVRFGPDIEWIESIDRPDVYDVDPRRAAGFYAEVRKYWPALADDQLVPGYSGIRPKISAPEAPARDFLIQTPADHGIPGLVHLFGIESPGLTSSLAIGERVAGLLGAGG